MRIITYIIFITLLFSCGDATRSRRLSSSANSNAFGDASGCPALYKPVCAQPPMPVCPEGIACVQVMPAPLTYDNECQMQKAGATLIQEGICP